ncbi:LCP family protein [Streptomyces sp. NBC_01619]|uniref:LCP family protein n=1 Tax=Streptomyces pratisoli TaxID=3139917 RepID=A0ACC6QHD2_9ACTN|nr:MULTISPECIES: LCP family protein [unclassified Streptomyces]MCX4511251.1 LCP family protein [Streptomyces sp. NBC_01619]
MGQSSVQGEGTRRRVRHAGERGWDDSLYEEKPLGKGATGGGDADGTPPAGLTPGGGSGGGDGRRRRGARREAGRRGKRRILRWVASVLSLLILGTAAAGYLYYEHLNNNIRKGERSAGDSKAQKPEPNAAGQTPLNVLLIGSDSRSSKANQQLGGSRDKADAPPLADVQMLLHVSADRKNASVVSIPRDTRVQVPECVDPATKKTYKATRTLINETLARGGPGCTLLTWESLTGVYIDHWMTVDFAGVVAMSDAVGGADVCVEQNVWDRPTAMVKGGSGLKLKAGPQTVEGEQALQWLRTRHAFYNDMGRSKAQHMYMNSVIRKLKKQNAFTDTGQLMDLAETATKSLQVSEEIGTVKKLFDLGMQLKDVPMERIEMLTMPWIQDPYDQNRVLPAPEKADNVWRMVRDDIPLDGKGPTSKPKPAAAPKDPAAPAAEIGVLVQNGTHTAQEGSVRGRATDVAGVLKDKGYARASQDSTSNPMAKTVVRYPSAELEGDAYAVAKSLGIPAGSVKKSTDVSGVTVVVGADWRTGDTFPKSAAPTLSREDTDALNGANETECMDVYAPYRW